MKTLSLSKEEIKRKLAGRAPLLVNDESLKHAAVLMPLFKKDNRWHVLFTLRTGTVSTHRNEISFPGGSLDEEEEALEAALRETEEEVGISPGEVEVLGMLDETRTITGFRITPFVGVIPYPRQFHVSEEEIAEIIEIPLDALADPKNYRRDDTWRFGGRSYPIHFFDACGRVVWGATARVLRQFLVVVLDWKEPG